MTAKKAKYLQDFRTHELVEELKTRQGVRTVPVAPHAENFRVGVYGVPAEYAPNLTIRDVLQEIEEDGPAVILIVTD